MAPLRRLRSLALITAPARAILMCSTVTMDSSSPSISKAVPTRKALVSINQELHRQNVAFEAETGDDAPGRGRRHAVGPESLGPGVEVGEVHLHGGHRQRPQAIVEGVGAVGE